MLGTVDAWLIWNLTGGPDGGVLATDATNASRTLLYDIRTRSWSDELCDIFGVPSAAPCPTCARRAVGSACARGARRRGDLAGVPVSGVAGDQQAALFGQACVSPGMAKVTYGTGSFVLMNVGAVCPPPSEGLLTTVAWDLGEHGGSQPVTYALEGAVFVTGAAIQWLRDGLGLIDEAAEIGPLAAQVDDSEGVFVVPAFTGLGSPWWDPYAGGPSPASPGAWARPHIARAVIEAMAYQVRDVVDAMAAAPARTLSASAGRRRGGGPRPVAPDPGRPARGCRWRVRHDRDPPRSEPPRWPDWPRGCGRRSTSCRLSGRRRPSSRPSCRPSSETRHMPPGSAARREVHGLGRPPSGVGDGNLCAKQELCAVIGALPLPRTGSQGQNEPGVAGVRVC